MLVMSLRGVNYRFWSHMWCLGWQSHCICPFKYHLGLCIKKFTYKALTLTTLGLRLSVSHTHIDLNLVTSISVTFICPPPPTPEVYRVPHLGTGLRSRDTSMT